jgi:hypothetical protein
VAVALQQQLCGRTAAAASLAEAAAASLCGVGCGGGSGQFGSGIIINKTRNSIWV